MAAPAFRASSNASATGNSSTTCVVTIPSAVAVDDLMIAVLGPGAASGAITPPSGWKRVPRMGGNGSATSAGRAWYKFAVAGDTGGAATATWTFANAIDSVIAFAAFSGVNLYVPFGSAHNVGGTDDQAMGSLYPPVNDCLGVWIAGGDSTADETTHTFTNANWTRRASGSNVNSRPWAEIASNTTDAATASRAGVSSGSTTLLSANAIWSGVSVTLVPSTQTAPFKVCGLRAANAGTTPATLTVSGPATGDTGQFAPMPGMVCVISAMYASETASAVTMALNTNGAAFTSYDSATGPKDHSGTDTMSEELFYLVVDESHVWNAVSETFTLGNLGAYDRSCAGFLAGNIDQTNPIQAVAYGEETANTTTPNPPSVAVDDYGVVLVFDHVADTTSATTPTAPSGYTNQVDTRNSVNSTVHSYLATKFLADAPATPEDPGAWAGMENNQHLMRVVSLFDIVTTSLSVNNPAVPDATETVAYAGVTFVGSGGHENSSGGYAWDISAGALPTGLTINASTGAISGTPSGTPGTYNFTVRATDLSGATATRATSMFLNALPSGGVAGWMSAVM